MMKVRVYHMPALDADLKWRPSAAWSVCSMVRLLQHVTDDAIEQWRGQLHASEEADGVHFDHLF